MSCFLIWAEECTAPIELNCFINVSPVESAQVLFVCLCVCVCGGGGGGGGGAYIPSDTVKTSNEL